MSHVEKAGTEASLKQGDMPTPRYMPYTTHNSSRRLIGIEAYSPDSELKTFLWFTNLTRGTIPELRHRDICKFASFIVRLRLDQGIDAAIGPAIDFEHSNSRLGKVATIDHEVSIGIYIEMAKRFTVSKGVERMPVRTMRELMLDRPQEAEELFERIMTFMPSVLRPAETKTSPKYQPRINVPTFSPQEREQLQFYTKGRLIKLRDKIPESLDDADLNRIRAPYSLLRALMFIQQAGHKKSSFTDGELKDISYRKIRWAVSACINYLEEHPDLQDVDKILQAAIDSLESRLRKK